MKRGVANVRGGTNETRGAERPLPPAAIIEEPEQRRRRPEGPGQAAMTSASTKVSDLGRIWGIWGNFGFFLGGCGGVGKGWEAFPVRGHFRSGWVRHKEGSGWERSLHGRFRGTGRFRGYWSQFGS